MKAGPVSNIAFYRFVRLRELESLRKLLKTSCKDLDLKGTIILSPEGINGFLAGTTEKMLRFQEFITGISEFSCLAFKTSFSETVPFRRLFIKLKKEIIPFGKENIDPANQTGARLLPRELSQWLDEGRKVHLLDTRNEFEVKAGTFENAVSLGLRNFREFPEKLKTLPAEWKNQPVVMFCTGGIRCEKATALALQEGFAQVYQLEGGILKYFEDCGDSHYKGDCFVFDERLKLNNALEPHPA